MVEAGPSHRTPRPSWARTPATSRWLPAQPASSSGDRPGRSGSRPMGRPGRRATSVFRASRTSRWTRLGSWPWASPGRTRSWSRPPMAGTGTRPWTHRRRPARRWASNAPTMARRPSGSAISAGSAPAPRGMPSRERRCRQCPIRRRSLVAERGSRRWGRPVARACTGPRPGTAARRRGHPGGRPPRRAPRQAPSITRSARPSGRAPDEASLSWNSRRTAVGTSDGATSPMPRAWSQRDRIRRISRQPVR